MITRHPLAYGLVLASVAMVSGCYKTYAAAYVIPLKEVRQPESAEDRYGNVVVTPVEEDGHPGFAFEDDLIRIVWFTSPSGFEFVLQNKTEHSMKLPWDEGAYVDAAGVSHRTIHGETIVGQRM